jgi:tetratricopeptide (TPR) repeat protein
LAKRDLDKAIELDSDSISFEVYHTRGYVNFNLGDLNTSIKDLNNAIEINDSDKESYAMRGLARIALGEKNQGCLDLSKAGELGLDKAYDFIKKHCN